MLEFLRKTYPFTETNSFVLEEIYLKLTTAEYKEGEVVKDYEIYSKEIMIIFTGEVALFSKSFNNEKDLLLETFTVNDMLFEQ